MNFERSLLIEDTPYADWMDPLSEAIRSLGEEACQGDEKQFLENLESLKISIKKILIDPILSIPMTRPMVLCGEVFLINEEGAPYLIEGAHYPISQTAVYDEETLLFYQKFLNHYGSSQEIIYQPHEFAIEVIRILELYPDKHHYHPLDASVDPTSPHADDFMLSLELASLNTAFVSYDIDQKRKERNRENLVAEAKERMVHHEIAQEYERQWKIALDRHKEDLLHFEKDLNEKKGELDEKVEMLQDRLCKVKKERIEVKDHLAKTEEEIQQKRRDLDILDSSNARENQRQLEVLIDYENVLIKAEKKKLWK